MKTPIIEPIAITGMSCRFPGAPSLGEFWTLLSEGRDGVSEVPADRWDAEALYDPDPKAQGKINTRKGGFLQDITMFDAAFFGITPREAGQMDPQQRILLELAYEAMEDAGLAPSALAGTDTAVYVGAMTNDYFREQVGDGFRRIDVHTGSGAGLCMLANRLSYQFDLRGPSATIDTACSSSLVAVYQACQSLWMGQSRVALAAGVNVMIDPAINVFYAKAGLSAPDARCKTFSAAADGIGRAEGAAVIVLKRLKDALADKDPIYAMIRGGAVNHDGRSNGLTQPNRWAQEQLLRDAFRHARVDPYDVQYIELHGTGTLIGDPIEANALGAVLGEGGSRPACLVGSVKTNFGHLEAAAGIAGLIKVALGISNGALPPSLWFDAPNPHIDFERLPLRVNTHLSPWDGVQGKRVAGVSSFGLGGANAHIVLQSPPAPRAPAKPRNKPAPAAQCLLISARSEAALRASARAYLRLLDGTPDSGLAGVCSTALRRKGVHDHRLAILGHDVASMIEALQAFGMDKVHPDILRGRYRHSQHALVLAVPEQDVVDWSLLSGIAAQPAAREAWTACRNVFGRHKITLPSADALDRTTRITINHPAFRAWHFAAQYALVRQTLGGVEEVQAILADGLGQLAVLCALGTIDLAEVPAQIISDRPVLEQPGDLGYPVPCHFSSGENPSFANLDWRAVGACWPQRLDGLEALREADVVVVGSDVANMTRTGELFTVNDSPDAWQRMFARLAVRHSLRWSAWAAEEGYARLPAYPWQREAHWLPALDRRGDRDAAQQVSPPVKDECTGLLGSRVDAPMPQWSRPLDPRRMPYLADHKVQGAIVLPGAAYVELGLAVNAALRGGPRSVLERLEFHNALLIDDSQPPQMSVTFDESGESFSVHSRARDGKAWELHARGRLGTAQGEGGRVDLDAIRAACTRHVDAAAHYQDMEQRGFGYGPAFQGVRELWVDAAGERVLARVGRAASLGEASEDEYLHPATFDAALQSLLATLTARGDRELYIPTGIEQLVLHARPTGDFWCYGGLRHAAPGTIEGEITLFDDRGHCLVEAAGVRAQALTRTERPMAQAADEAFYRWSWDEQSRSSAAVAGRWILLGEAARSDALAGALRQAGASDVIRVLDGDAFAQYGESTYTVRPDSTDLADLVPRLMATGIAGVVHEAKVTDDTPFAAGIDAQPLLSLLREFGRDGASSPARLVLLTRGLQAVNAPGEVDGAGLWQAPLIGLARVVTNEFPGLRVRVLDRPATGVTLEELAAEIVCGSAEDEVALRPEGRYVHRLRKLSVAELDAQAGREGTSVRGDATYLVTGGFGGFGLELAEWLVAQGARSLVLAGRRGATSEQVRERIDGLRSRGAYVAEERVDVGIESEVIRLLESARGNLPPLKGVFHAAAVLDDAAIGQLTPEQIDRAMAAKAHGAWYLHRHTQADSLDHFVLFSSIASLLGGAGQASYAMSCASLDALARFRRGQDLAALSMNWGALADVGMATRYGDVAGYLSSTGVGMFAPVEAMRHFGRALCWPHAEVGIARMDWRQWAASYAAWAVSPKNQELLTGSTPAAAASRTGRAALGDVPVAEREAVVTQTLVRLLAETIDADAEDLDLHVPLPSLGLDSLMAMDLLVAIEDRFGVKVPMLALMKGNSLVQLAQLVLAEVSAAGFDAPDSTGPQPIAAAELPTSLDLEQAERFIAGLEGLADEEVERLLQQIMEEEELR